MGFFSKSTRDKGELLMNILAATYIRFSTYLRKSYLPSCNPLLLDLCNMIQYLIVDFDVESQPPLVTATPVPVDYATTSSLPTAAEVISNTKINNASNNTSSNASSSKFNYHH